MHGNHFETIFSESIFTILYKTDRIACIESELEIFFFKNMKALLMVWGHFTDLSFVFIIFLSALLPPSHSVLKCHGWFLWFSFQHYVAQWKLSIWRLLSLNSEKISSIISSLFSYQFSFFKTAVIPMLVFPEWLLLFFS